MRIIEQLTLAVRSTTVYNHEIQVAPACILWPDSDRQWEAVIPLLQTTLPELLILGDYAPENRTGPAIWLRCAIAGQAAAYALPKECTPILYLPGVSRQDLRAVESCPDHLKPLAELQYRGAIWSQLNAKDWTLLAFLKSDQGGLGLDVAQDNDAKRAMQLALYRLLEEEVALLQGKRLDKDYFNTLLTGDPVRDLLLWLDQGDLYRRERGENEWQAFVEVCKSQLAFDPQNEGILAGAAKLAARSGPWQAVWARYCEAPTRYPNLPQQIRRCAPPRFDLFVDAETAGSWPQWNEAQEQNLHHDLVALDSLPPHQARSRLLELAQQHGPRRHTVWAELGEATLAQALAPLAELAQTTQHALVAGSAAELAAAYGSSGWRADRAVVQALSLVTGADHLAAVGSVIRAVYLPWAEESARYLQKVVDAKGYPGGTIATTPGESPKQGLCLLFVDGLRLDLARKLTDLLTAQGCTVTERPTWAALPTVTATGKPAVTPVRDKIRGQDVNVDFEPGVAAGGQSLKGGYQLPKLLKDAGWTLLPGDATGDGQGSAWSEFGDIDHEGHDRGWKLARQIDALLGEVRERVLALLGAGWQRVRVVTDHGWLLLPGGLPKVELPSALAENKWGRCAALKPGAATDERLYPWFWNPSQHFALADGISCFRSGAEYAHGGVSLQECLTLELTVTAGLAGSSAVGVAFTDIAWKGLRCTVAVEGAFATLVLDLRTQAGNPASSVVVSVKPLKENGTASVVVEDEELAGSAATLVLLAEGGELEAQAATVIGGGDA